jgi:hypothetical protein
MSTEEITAKSLTLVDSSGKPRILLDGGGDTGHASIRLLSPTGPSIQLSAQPSGIVAISLDQHGMAMALTIGPRGIIIRDTAGRLGVSIGDPFSDSGELVPSVTIYRDGQPVFSLPPDETATNEGA